MEIEIILINLIRRSFKDLFAKEIPQEQILLQKTRKEFKGDFTFNVFPFLKITGSGPEITAEKIGRFLIDESDIFSSFNVVKGFLNIEFTDTFWLKQLEKFEVGLIVQKGKKIKKVIEYCGPNTNKPLHLGHVRNCLLGFSLAEILNENGQEIIKVNIVNDRGIHICKSMLAWQRYGKGETPSSSGLKGDHLVGKFYVEFDKHYKQEVESLVSTGIGRDEAEKEAPLMKEVQEMLRKWEAGDVEVISLWKTMNSWVLKGFEYTYANLGIDFQKTYFESETYLIGKKIIEEGLKNGQLFKKEDNSVWIDLTEDGLDQKLLLRGDGTSVYITQDIGTAWLRFQDFGFDEMIYVVANEQDYHFKVLKLILIRLGFEWANGIHHMSYGMVELPEGKMKSREGTVVDADELIEEMVESAREVTLELGKISKEEDHSELFKMVGMGALKYFILKVDPKKRMVFNPKESIDLNGNTGPFIQYSFARINSVINKHEGTIEKNLSHELKLNEKERNLLKLILEYSSTLKEAGKTYSPAIIANYAYDLAKTYNQFYHDFPILKEANPDLKNFRLVISQQTGVVIKKSMNLLGMQVPERM